MLKSNRCVGRFHVGFQRLASVQIYYRQRISPLLRNRCMRRRPHVRRHYPVCPLLFRHLTPASCCSLIERSPAASRYVKGPMMMYRSTNLGETLKSLLCILGVEAIDPLFKVIYHLALNLGGAIGEIRVMNGLQDLSNKRCRKTDQATSVVADFINSSVFICVFIIPGLESNRWVSSLFQQVYHVGYLHNQIHAVLHHHLCNLSRRFVQD